MLGVKRGSNSDAGAQQKQAAGLCLVSFLKKKEQIKQQQLQVPTAEVQLSCSMSSSRRAHVYCLRLYLFVIVCG